MDRVLETLLPSIEIRHSELCWITFPQILPMQRDRHTHALSRAWRIRGYSCRSTVVAQVIEKDAPYARGLGHLDQISLRAAGFEHLRNIAT